VLPLTPANRLFGQKIDRPAVSHLLDSIHHEDQLNRDRLVAMDQNWNDSLQESYDALWATQKQIDRHNMLAIEDLHNKYGWDTLMTLPDTAKLVIFLVIQHSDSLHLVKYLPLLKRSVRQGDLPGQDYALLKDRVTLMVSGKQYFGSQLYWDGKQKKYLPLPITGGAAAAERRRVTLGLETLEAYLDRCNNGTN
jgi:hypothetical protein